MIDSSISYKESGVDILKGAELVRLIKSLSKTTGRREVIKGVGGFSALFDGSFKNYQRPVIVSSTDGVGTKLMIAFMTGRHNTIGIDLVAMCVNDLITCGAEPLFFLDYFAAGKLDVNIASQVIRGLIKGCVSAGCALIGGETAEMPDLYKKGEYDIAGFAVGVVDKKKVIDGTRIRPGDFIVGLPSSGLHSNGYSLARKIIFNRLGLAPSDKPRGLKKTISSELITPTRIYVKIVHHLLENFDLKGIAHITGGGLTENIPRVLPEGLKAVIKRGTWPQQPIFRFIQRHGPVKESEMLRTFNCGIGMTLIVSKMDTAGVMKKLNNIKEKAYIIGSIEKRGKKETAIEII